MKMIPEQSLGQLLPLFSLVLAVNLGATSTRPPDQVDHTHNTSGLTNTIMDASKHNSTTAAAVFPRSNQSMFATTKMFLQPDSNQSHVITTAVSHNSSHNGTLPMTSEQNATTSMADSTYVSGSTISSHSTPNTQVPADSKPSWGPTTSSPIAKPSTSVTPAGSAASVAMVKTTIPPSTAPTTQRAKVPGSVYPANNPTLALTPIPSTKTLSTTLGAPFDLKHSNKTMTIVFGSLLGVTALLILLYTLDRCKQKKTQYLHRPLYNNSQETVDRFLPADDTLVISGGLYDGPRVYNPTMTTANEDEDFHCGQPPFDSRSTQFQLKLLKDEGEKPPSYEASTGQTSLRFGQDE